MSEHTKEPWIAEECKIRSDANLIASTWLPRAMPDERLSGESWLAMRERTEAEREAIKQEAVANARRIVACVNACAGIKTIDLECLAEAGSNLLDKSNEAANILFQQRDALRAALEESRCYVKAHTVHHAPESGGPWALLEQIDAALAQCQGEPT